MTKIRSIVAPLAGQSVNPTLNAHKSVLKQVVQEEEKQIEDDYKGSMQQAQHGGKNAQAKLKQLRTERLQKQEDEVVESESEEESDSSEEDQEALNSDDINFQKPVDRLKKLTKNQRNQKKDRKVRNLKQISEAKERKFQRQYDNVPIFVN